MTCQKVICTSQPQLIKFFTLEPVVIDGKEKLLMKSDRHVVIRPKAYSDSSGNTWPNETERLRLLYPDDLEAKDLRKSYSSPITTYNTCKYRQFERQWLGHFAR